MELAEFRWYRLAAALVIGLGIEVLAGICVISFLPPQWDHWIGDLPLQPSEYLVGLLFKGVHLGFEGQVVPLLLILVLQWMIYSAAVYLLLAISWKKRDAASGR